LSGKVILISLLSGLSTAGFVVTWILLVQRGAYMMVVVSTLLGVLIPMLYCHFVYAEIIKNTQWLGLVVLLVATYIMSTYNRSQRGKMSPGILLLYILCGSLSGLTDLSQKLFVHEIPEIGASCFSLYTYMTASLILISCWLLSIRKSTQPAVQMSVPSSPSSEQSSSVPISTQPAVQMSVPSSPSSEQSSSVPISTQPTVQVSVPSSEQSSSVRPSTLLHAKAFLKKALPYICIMSVCLFLNSYFKTLAASRLTSAVLYPMAQGGDIMLSQTMATLIFKEKLTGRCMTGLFLAFGALLMMNLL